MLKRVLLPEGLVAKYRSYTEQSAFVPGASGKGPSTVMLLVAGRGEAVAEGHVHAGAVG